MLPPGGGPVHQPDIDQRQRDDGKFDQEKRIADVIGGFHAQHGNAATYRQNKTDLRHGGGGPRQNSQRYLTPGAQHPQIQDQDGAEQQDNAQNVDQVDDAVTPHAQGTNERSQPGMFQPG